MINWAQVEARSAEPTKGSSPKANPDIPKNEGSSGAQGSEEEGILSAKICGICGKKKKNLHEKIRRSTDIAKGKISFISPLAKTLINKKTGEVVILKRAKEDTVFEIMGIAYEE